MLLLHPAAGPQIRQKKLEASRGESGAKIWWSAAVPSPAIGSDFMMKRSEARYRLGWSALISKFGAAASAAAVATATAC